MIRGCGEIGWLESEEGWLIFYVNRKPYTYKQFSAWLKRKAKRVARRGKK